MDEAPLNYTLNLPPWATWHIIPLSCWHIIIQILQTFVCWWYLLHSSLIIKHKGNPQISHLNCDKLTYLIDNFVFGVDLFNSPSTVHVHHLNNRKEKIYFQACHISYFSHLFWIEGFSLIQHDQKFHIIVTAYIYKKNTNGFCKCLTKFLEFFELFFIRKENYLIIQGILLLKQAHV